MENAIPRAQRQQVGKAIKDRVIEIRKACALLFYDGTIKKLKEERVFRRLVEAFVEDGKDFLEFGDQKPARVERIKDFCVLKIKFLGIIGRDKFISGIAAIRRHPKINPVQRSWRFFL